LSTFLRAMWIGPVTASAVIAGLELEHRGFALGLIPLSLWFISPWAGWWMGWPRIRPTPKLTSSQLKFLHELSRKTWKFFETFVGPEDHWLPPDNFQERPVPQITHRTSPTNIGLAMLANLAAYDFGYITLDQLIERTANALDTLEKMERHLGHFYNW